MTLGQVYLNIIPSVKFFFPFLTALALSSLIAAAQKSDGPYWAYRAVQNIPVPERTDPFVKNPIDAFILAGLREKGLTPNKRATDSQLQRRLSYDLTGLPPQASSLRWPALVAQHLASPRFGEKFASHWLDLVRYGETNGFERDSEKPEIWRYRDYVIQSFNDNKPYDRFLVEQLAGDQLPDRTLATSIATGFMTLMQRDDEPADRPQAQADTISDIVDVTSEAFMGATLGCAKCHDHKGDPLSQADYFSMRSFFGAIKQDHFKSSNHVWIDPSVVQDREKQKRANQQTLQTLWKTIDTSALDPLLKKSPQPAPIETNWLRTPRIPANPGWSLPSFDAPAVGFKTSDKWPRDKPLTLRSEFGLTEIPSQFLVYLKADLQHLEIFLNGTRVHEGITEKVHGEYFIPLPLDQLTTGKNVIGIIAKSQRRQIQVRVTRAPLHDLSPDQLALIHPGLVSKIYGDHFGSKMKPLQDARRDLERPLAGIPYHGVHEDQNVAAPRIHKRGSVHALGDEVPIAFPVVLDPKKATPPRTRLALAKWITHPDHPLTARVWVNRLWQYCFGHGLVESANDFGTLGTSVTNQDLLDWLAAELVRSNWDTKHMLRLILTSSTYQLSSTGLSNEDPTNKLHWKHSSRRLTAEEIWDSYLVLTKQMKFDLGGPPVRPKMPDAVLATSSQPGNVWRPSPGDSSNRRAVYIHAKRSIKLPILANFDSPERDLSCPSRFATTVPTQALTMLNSERMNEFSDHFAARLQGTLDEKITQAFHLATSRKITQGELHELTTLAQDLQETHQVPEDQLIPRLCLLILNLNETIYLD
ncbi:MAG: hypothetical protein ACJAQT_003281 [Akkermansiaceae bacterium]